MSGTEISEKDDFFRFRSSEKEIQGFCYMVKTGPAITKETNKQPAID